MGPFGYQIKYGFYPHNALLQLLCETGLIGTIPMLALIILSVIRIFKAGWTNHFIRRLFLFFVVYAVQANMSGNLWECSALLCALGYGLTVVVENKHKPESVQKTGNLAKTETKVCD